MTPEQLIEALAEPLRWGYLGSFGFGVLVLLLTRQKGI